MEQIKETADSSRFRPWQAVTTFFNWWFAELGSWVSPPSRTRQQSREHQLVIDFDANWVVLKECHQEHETVIGQYVLSPDGSLPEEGRRMLLRAQDKAATKLIICLPREEVLFRTLTLPIKAEENLRQVLGYEMDLQTPFRAEQVYYDYRIIEKLPEHQQLRVWMVVVPRAKLDRLVKTVSEWGVQPAVVTVTDESGGEVEQCSITDLNLLPQEQRVKSGGSWSMLNRLLTISAILFGIAALLIPLLLQEKAIKELERDLAANKEKVEAIQSMRDEIDKVIAGSRMILKKKQQYPPIIDTLNELSSLLPDDTWLERLSVKGSEIKIYGVSSDASALIELIENSTLFHDAAFDSPITRDSRTNSYRFQIEAMLTGEDL